MLYNEIDQIVSTTHDTVNKLLQYKNWPDALALYFRYIQQRKMQDNTTTFSSDDFMIKAMKWWKERFYKTKKILVETRLIEVIKRKDELWKIVWWYIKVNFIIQNTTLLENQSLENPESDKQGTNTLVENINTLVEKEIQEKKKFLSLQEYKTEDWIKQRMRDIFTDDVMKLQISKYRLLLLFVNKWYNMIEDSKEWCDIFFQWMIDRSNRYWYSAPWFADWDILLLKSKEMFEWAEWWTREIKNYMSTLNKFLTPNTSK